MNNLNRIKSEQYLKRLLEIVVPTCYTSENLDKTLSVCLVGCIGV